MTSNKFHLTSYSVVVALVIMTTIQLTVTSDDVITRDGSLTRGCCWPLQFTAHIGRAAGMPVGGAPGVLEEEMLLEFDHDANRWGFWLRDNYRTNEYMELIYTEDYSKKKWTIASFQGCARMPIKQHHQMYLPCVPGSAELLETSWLGEGEGRLFYDVWGWEFDHREKGENTTTRVVASVFHDNCTPMSEISWWHAENFDYTSYISFLDINLGKSDLSPFDDLELFYTCKDHKEKPQSIDARISAIPEGEYLLRRITNPNGSSNESS